MHKAPPQVKSETHIIYHESETFIEVKPKHTAASETPTKNTHKVTCRGLSAPISVLLSVSTPAPLLYKAIDGFTLEQQRGSNGSVNSVEYTELYMIGESDA